MPTLTVTSTVANNNHDGSQTWAERATASPTALFTGGTTIVGPSTTTSNVRNYFFIFRFGDGSSGSGIAQGSDITSAKLNLRFNNGITSASLIKRIYVTVENNLDPLGTGAITAGTLGTMPWRRLGRQSDAVTLFGARAGPTHTGTLSSTGVGVTDTSAYVYKAFADGRTINATTFNLTDSFAPALQKLIDDSSWNGDSQYVMVNVFSDPNATAGTDGVGRLDSITWASGQTGTTDTYASSGGQLTLRDSNVSYAAQLIVDVDLPVTNDSFTTTAPVMNASVPTQSALAYIKYTDVSYHDSIGDTTRRIMDIYTPTSSPPSGGFPVAFFVHGGAFNAGSKADVASSIPFLTDVFNAGMAIVSINYKFTEGNLIFNTNTGWVRPSTTQDVFAALKFVKTAKATYSLNDEKIIAFGYSAGGHVMLDALLGRQDSARDSKVLTYRGLNTTLGTRYDDYTANTVSQGRSMTDVPMPKGFLSFAGPVDLKNTHDNNAVVAPLIKIYFGQAPNNGYPGVTGEANLNSYIKAEAGTIYSTGSPIVPTYPIALMYATGDTTVVTSSSYTALEAALSTVGYDVSQASNGNVATGVAFSRYGTAISGNGGGHDTIFSKYDRTFFQNWLSTALTLAGGVETTTDITKSASYAIRITTTPTKSAQYAVSFSTTPTKTALYLVSILVNITKTAQYTVPNIVSTTKSAQYSVIGLANITKSAQYTVNSVINITKSGNYAVLRLINITKSASYVVQSTGDITKSATYVVQVTTSSTVTKSAQYVVSSTVSITKTAAYVAKGITVSSITKSASYSVLSNGTLQRTGNYEVAGTSLSNITKTAQYVVLTTTNITKSAPYSVATTTSITRSAQYVLVGASNDTTLTKSAQYTITRAISGSVSSAYAISKLATATKSAAYVVSAQVVITKVAQYAITRTLSGTVTSGYAIGKLGNITKTASYVVTLASGTSKSAQYAVRTTTSQSLSTQYLVIKLVNITKSASYSVGLVTVITKPASYSVVARMTKTLLAVYAVHNISFTPEIGDIIEITDSNKDFEISL